MKLIAGPYHAPKFHYGDVLTDEVRGFEVVVVGLTDARIPWPVGKPLGGRAKAPIVCGDLERAVRLESNLAVCHWFGITAQTVTKWRKALGVPRLNDGSKKLAIVAAANNTGLAISRTEQHELQRDAEADKERRRKIAKRLTGKFKKWSHIRKVVKANTGRKATASTRAKLSEFHKTNRSFLRLKQGVEWTAEEDAVLRSMTPRKAALELRRTLASVYSRRHELGLNDGRGLSRPRA